VATTVKVPVILLGCGDGEPFSSKLDLTASSLPEYSMQVKVSIVLVKLGLGYIKEP